jgi:MFS family permease
MTSKSMTLTDRLPATFASLRYPNYRRWFIGQALSLMGTWMQSVAQGWLVYQLTGSKLALGTISFAGSIPTFFLMLPAGALADRIPRRRMLLITQSTMMALAFVLTILTATGILQVWHIALLAFLLGIANSFDAPARQALAVEMVEDRRDLQNAIGLNSTMFNLARVVGPAVGGLVLASLGATWCFALNGLSFGAVLIALAGMRLPEQANVLHSGRLMSQVGVGLRYVRQHKEIRAIVALVAVSGLFGMSYAVLLPAYAVDILHVGEAGLGGLNAAVGVGALFGALIVATLSRSQRKGIQLAAGSFIFPAALICFAFSRSFAWSSFFLALAGFGFVSQNSTSNTIVQSLVPDDLRGRVMGIYSLMFFGSTPFGSLLAGSVAQAWGPVGSVLLSAGITLLFALFIFLHVPSLRHVAA